MRWLLIGCLIWGCGGEEETEPEAEPPVMEAEPPEVQVVDEGEPAPPGRPAFVIRELGFGRLVSPGVSEGFDLDDRVSERDDEESCFKYDYVGPDGTPGIDNQLAQLIPVLEQIAGDVLDGLVQGAINDGALMIVVEQGPEAVHVTQAMGVPFLGTDGRILGDQTMLEDPEVPRVRAEYTVDGDTVTAGPIHLPIPVNVLQVSFTLNIQQGRIRFSKQEDGTYRGVMAGEVEVQEVIDAIAAGDVGSATDIAERVLSGQADMRRNEEGVCEAFSAVLLFEAVPIYLAEWE